MKDLSTGELSGPPLPHDEWLAEQAEVERQDARDREARRPKGAGAHRAPSAPGAPVDGGGEDLNDLTVAELHDRAKAAGIEGQSSMNKAELVDALSKRQK